MEPLSDESPWKPKAISGILRNPSLRSGRAALMLRDSGGGGISAGGQRSDGGMFRFLYRSVLTEVAAGPSPRFLQLFGQKMFLSLWRTRLPCAPLTPPLLLQTVLSQCQCHRSGSVLTEGEATPPEAAHVLRLALRKLFLDLIFHRQDDFLTI